MNNLDIIRAAAKHSNLDVYGLGLNRDKYEAALERYTKIIVTQTIDEFITQMWKHNIDDQSNNPEFYKAIIKTKQHFGVTE